MLKSVFCMFLRVNLTGFLQCGFHFRLIALAPRMGNNLYLMSKFIMDEVSRLLKRINRDRREISAQITCQLAITEYGGICDPEEDEGSTAPVKNKMNFNFTLNLDEK